MHLRIDPETALPTDRAIATLVGRVWMPGPVPGPVVAAVRGDDVVSLAETAGTVSELFELEEPDVVVHEAIARAPSIGSLSDVLANTPLDGRDPSRPHLLAPLDLQPIKAAGVTFAASLLERVIDECAKGRPEDAQTVRSKLVDEIGADAINVTPGSREAMRLKEILVRQGLWSQYLEVGIGPDAEIFTKCTPLAAVGTGYEIGVHPCSEWNNPEPEVVLAINSRAEIVGATLGNDVNLRDVEGRSALLLGRAKDNAASCALGPFVRLIDDSYGLDDMRTADVSLHVVGDDGFELQATSSMSRISRDIVDLKDQTIGPHHRYPDGLALFTGTMFAPTKDRDQPGRGFTHKVGDLVTVSTPSLGTLTNRVNRTDRVEEWAFGLGALMRCCVARQ